ncbi:hypothetical protein ASE01_15400 [Nocardioides sp. Root190]|uniref:CoA transferase n=1 Tax=Nocardioides sp. Root190 TaxID=1736488 RepID=UPI0006FF4042|nr:CoA transferase [Nocardioides sp. Root190]KRB76372.1 hypothetical protein ASE01_15400 [Nocardioides sp. Root190]
MDASELWAASGAMALTGRADGPPVLGPGHPAAYVHDHLEALGLPTAPLRGLLGERAAHAGLARHGPWSCGGAMRVLPTADGHLALSLARPEDLDLVPALVEQANVTDPWASVARWAADATAAEAEQRVHLLGLPGGRVGPPGAPGPRPAVVRMPGRPVTVLDLTALWAGPLATHLLHLLGARVVKVESRHRPDGARRGSPTFFSLLDRGKEHVVLDLPDEVSRLRELALAADVVVESSRPRALAQLGLDAAEVVAAGTSWVSITARGRDSDTIGFGDDVAACAGHVVADVADGADGADLLPVGDALADPLAGVRTAWACVDVLQGPARLVEVSMLDVARAAAAGAVPEHRVEQVAGVWWLETASGRSRVEDPRMRP